MDLDEYVVRSTGGRKHRHRPKSDDEDLPDCGRTTRIDRTEWRRVDACQTVFYEDCRHCFVRDCSVAVSDD